MAEGLILILRHSQTYGMTKTTGQLGDTIYIICWGVDEPTHYAIFSKRFNDTVILLMITETKQIL